MDRIADPIGALSSERIEGPKVRHYEAIIVGGGPAGSAAAYLLAQAGIRVLLIEAGKSPHRKVCGEFLCYEGIELLERMGLRHLVESPQVLPGLGAKIITQRGRSITGQFPQQVPERPGGYCLNRELFDEGLLAEAESHGASLLRAARVTTISPMAEGWEVRTLRHQAFTCDLLIGADGIRSLVAQQLKLSRPNRKKKLALRCFLPTRRKNPRTIEMHLLPRGNYIGLDVVEDHAVNFSVVVDPETMKAKGGAEGLIRYYYETFPALRENMLLPEYLPPIEAISPVSHTVRSCIADNAALIGDAGGFVEPLTGEGITIALWTASALAEQLIRWKAQGQWHRRNNALKAYRRAKEKHYWQKKMLSSFFFWFIRQEVPCEWACGYLQGNFKRKDAFMGLLNNTYTPIQGLLHLVRAAF